MGAGWRRISMPSGSISCISSSCYRRRSRCSSWARKRICARPFPFFGDLKGHLVDEIREGRIQQARDFFGDAGAEAEVPDPVSADTMAAAKLDWSEFDRPERQEALARFRELVRLRTQHILPLTAGRYGGSEAIEGAGGIAIRWRYATGTLALAMNPSPRAGSIEIEASPPFATTGDAAVTPAGLELSPWSAAIWIEAP